MYQSKSTVWRHRQAERAASAVEGRLPMPVGAYAGKVSVAERLEYQARRRQHLAQYPDYDAGWERPTPATAAAVCALLTEYLPSLDVIHLDALTAQQLVVVALDLAVGAGRYGRAQRRKRAEDGAKLLRNVRRTVTKTRLFDAVARRWSDHYRLARETGRAFSVAQLARSTVEAARRDLLRLGISLPTLWNLATVAKWPLYTLQPSQREGLVVTLTDSPLLDKFERLVRTDPSYGPTRAEQAWRLWVDGHERPAVSGQTSIVAEQAYNVPVFGEGTQEILQLQEDGRLLFLSEEFVLNFDETTDELAITMAEIETRYPTKLAWSEMTDSERGLRKWKSRMRAFQLEYQAVYDQVQDLKRAGFPMGPFGAIPIRSAYTKVLNRRFQALHFSPMAVSDRLEYMNFTLPLSPRRGWFAFPGVATLVDRDVSSSQTQLLAVFLGDKDLENAAVLSPVPFKTRLAALAWDVQEKTGQLLHEGYTGPDDGGLVAACKDLWMRYNYGSTVRNVIREQSWEPETYGPVWQDATAVQAFIDSVPGFQAVETFLMACRYIGRRAGTVGLTLTDPLDGSAFMWNPTEFADVRVAWDDYDVSLVEPGRYPVGRCPECGVSKSTRQGNRRTCRNKDKAHRHTWTVEFKPNVADPETGAWPVEKSQLRNMVAPCLVHMLDGLYAACVMRELHSLGVRDFVSLHDAWYVPETVTIDGQSAKGLDVLRVAMEAAGKPWLLALGPVYEWLAQQLAGTPWADMVETARQRWKDRVSAADWPVFSAH